ncbi:MAG: CoA-binding protein, partial [Sneathiellales bacterium]|nr:CoA-binding protein [Sneathiellales bacterium]
MELHSNLDSLFYPKKIAVIGATNKENKVGRIIFERVIPSGAELFPVHPKETEILGYKAYNKIEDLPENIDIAIV